MNTHIIESDTVISICVPLQLWRFLSNRWNCSNILHHVIWQTEINISEKFRELVVFYVGAPHLNLWDVWLNSYWHHQHQKHDSRIQILQDLCVEGRKVQPLKFMCMNSRRTVKPKSKAILLHIIICIKHLNTIITQSKVPVNAVARCSTTVGKVGQILLSCLQHLLITVSLAYQLHNQHFEDNLKEQMQLASYYKLLHKILQEEGYRTIQKMGS